MYLLLMSAWWWGGFWCAVSLHILLHSRFSMRLWGMHVSEGRSGCWCWNNIYSTFSWRLPEHTQTKKATTIIKQVMNNAKEMCYALYISVIITLINKNSTVDTFSVNSCSLANYSQYFSSSTRGQSSNTYSVI